MYAIFVANFAVKRFVLLCYTY